MKISFVEAAQNFGGARKAALTMACQMGQYAEVTMVDFYGSCRPFVEACEASVVPFHILSPSSKTFAIRSASSIWSTIKNLLLFLPHLWAMNKKLLQYLNQNKVDWMCVSGFRPLMCLIFGRPKSTKIVYFAHGWYLNRDLSRFQRYLLRHYVDRIVCISEATKQAIYNNGIASLENLYVVQNSIDASKCDCSKPLEIQNPAGKPMILLSGGFTKGKGQLLAVEIAEELSKRGFEYIMVLAGIIYQGRESQNYFEKVKASITQKGLENEVNLLLNKHNIMNYVKACDVLIHPSWTEGFPLAVMEAQAFGKPVVVNAVGGVTDMVLHQFTGMIPRYNNVSDYADYIIELMSNPEKYRFISNNAKRLAETCFSPQKQFEQLKKVFE